MDSMSYIVKYKKNGYPIFLDEVLISMLISGDKVLVNILREALVDFICWKRDINYFDFFCDSIFQDYELIIHIMPSINVLSKLF